MQDALGLTCDRVYRWLLLLEEYGPEIVYIKEIHNTVSDAISGLDFGPTKDVKKNWMTFTKCWCHYTMQAEEDPSPVKHSDLMNYAFAKRSEENAIYTLTVQEIAAAQQKDKMLDKLSLLEAYKPQLVGNVQVLCKDGKLVIPQELQQRAVQWYHHYLQHPGTTRLEETLCAVMYLKGLRHSVSTFVKNCHKCQVNKRRQHTYGKLPTKLVVSNPWEVLCVDLIGPYTLKGKDSTEIVFMCVTMIDPATSWFELVELLKIVCNATKIQRDQIELLAIVETLKEFKGMLWGQTIKVYTDHKNLIQDALGLTSDCVYRWRLLLEEYGPKIMHIKGIHNTVAVAISRLDSGPTQDDNANWMTFTKCWCHYTEHVISAGRTHDHQEDINLEFANNSGKDVIYPSTVKEIAQAQTTDATLKNL
eukprot:CCRYP_012531-RA/>CCRYP_012531-RA protein AED:0.27 eAED:0.36 QI:0/0/0/1/0/0/2/0/417